MIDYQSGLRWVQSGLSDWSSNWTNNIRIKGFNQAYVVDYLTGPMIIWGINQAHMINYLMGPMCIYTGACRTGAS